MALGGLDIGTSGCKFVAFDLEGRVLCECKGSYPEYGTDGIREINPEEVWKSVLQVLREASKTCPEQIEGFAITSLGESAVALDGQDRPLNNSMVTGDKRGMEESRKLIQQFGREEIMNLTGIPPSEMYALPKFLWLHRHTRVIEKTKFLFLYEDYIAYRLTGERNISYSSASRTMAFDIHKKKWSEELLGAAGITVGQMSKPVPSGTIVGKLKKEISLETGLSEETVLVAGGHDQMCAALGGGVLDSSVTADGMGTCEVLATFLNEARTDTYMLDHELACIPYVKPDTYLTYLVMTNCGSLMNWYRDTYFKAAAKRQQNIFHSLDRQAEDKPSGLLVIPNFGSAGNPHVDYSARGLVWGLTIHTRQDQIYRGLKEGMAYHMRLCTESLSEIGAAPEKIHAVGGGAASELTLQIRADVFGIPVCMMEHSEAGTRGCMMLAGIALNKYETLAAASERTIRLRKVFYPRTGQQEEYEGLYQKYKKLYEMSYKFK